MEKDKTKINTKEHIRWIWLIILEVFISAILFLFTLLGLIFSLIVISKHINSPNINIQNAIEVMVIGIFNMILVIYLIYQTFYNSKVYDIELTARLILIVIAIFASITIFGMGLNSFLEM